jgi:hypothetical protein
MSIRQIEYIDKLLPYFGCDGVSDSESLFNKSTIGDWDQLQEKLNNDMSLIKTIFPTKSLNLARMDSVVSTPQQAVAMLRGLMKITSIPFIVVRKKNNEFLRLNLQNNTLMYYIIHKKMTPLSLKKLELNRDYSGQNIGIVKKFYVKFLGQELPHNPKFRLLVNHSEMAKTTKLIYSQQHNMWEIQFYSRIVNLCDIPSEFSDVLFLNLVTSQMIQIYSATPSELYAEIYDDQVMSELGELLKTCNDGFIYVCTNNTVKVQTYVEFAEQQYTVKNNILSFSCGLLGLKYSIVDRKYDPTAPLIDLFDGTHEYCNNYCQIIEKYIPKQTQLSELVGTTGSTGPSGCTGTYWCESTGCSGTTGYTGTYWCASTGCSGTTGSTGPVGCTGTYWDNGLTGCSGTTGCTGIYWDGGATGCSGTTGCTGIYWDGATGCSGTTGCTGIYWDGATGCSGTTGCTGTYWDGGATGCTGTYWANGSTGFTGCSKTYECSDYKYSCKQSHKIKITRKHV